MKKVNEFDKYSSKVRQQKYFIKEDGLRLINKKSTEGFFSHTL